MEIIYDCMINLLGILSSGTEITAVSQTGNLVEKHICFKVFQVDFFLNITLSVHFH